MRYYQCKYCGSRNAATHTHCHRCERDLPLGVLKKLLVAAIVVVALALAVSSVYPLIN